MKKAGLSTNFQYPKSSKQSQTFMPKYRLGLKIERKMKGPRNACTPEKFRDIREKGPWIVKFDFYLYVRLHVYASNDKRVFIMVFHF